LGALLARRSLRTRDAMLTRRSLALLGLLGLAAATARAQEQPDVAALREELMALEKESWEYLKTRDRAAMRRFLPDDALLIFSGTRYDKDAMLDHMANYRLDHYEIEPTYGLRAIGPDAAVLIYRVTSRGAIRLDRTTTDKVLATSLYVRRNGRWRAVLYLETPSNTPNLPDGNRPASAPAAIQTVSAQPVDAMALREELMALERVGWDFMRNDNQDGMRHFLDDDALLIFGDGNRYNKRQTLELMKDFALVDLSIEPSYAVRPLTPGVATLLYRVTYSSRFKGGKPATVKALSSSIYARRDGKWWSVLYQETPIK
jgi:Domain of unknown function (DUF4440)